MAEIILVTGGARSGKSSHAQQLAEKHQGKKLFVATCPVTDPEMEERIKLHQADRQHGGWTTVEETVDLENPLKGHQEFQVVVVDCLTLWVNNLLFTDSGNSLDEKTISLRAEKLLEVCLDRHGVVILVTNEVGLGIVPENPLARRYRDLVGRCNQVVGSAADRVILVTCGIPMNIKDSNL